ncbi:hypothetical protein PPACK8108_LOCUS18583, partial [Phakopsora pachyrhizi]
FFSNHFDLGEHPHLTFAPLSNGAIHFLPLPLLLPQNPPFPSPVTPSSSKPSKIQQKLPYTPLGALLFPPFPHTLLPNLPPHQWIGPYQVVEQAPWKSYALKELDGTWMACRFAAAHIKKFYT